mgnify:CR=1 FL=1
MFSFHFYLSGAHLGIFGGHFVAWGCLWGHPNAPGVAPRFALCRKLQPGSQPGSVWVAPGGSQRIILYEFWGSSRKMLLGAPQGSFWIIFAAGRHEKVRKQRCFYIFEVVLSSYFLCFLVRFFVTNMSADRSRGLQTHVPDCGTCFSGVDSGCIAANDVG